MSFNQFSPAEEQATFQQIESNPYMNVTAEQFAYLMRYAEAARGAPCAPKMLSVFSTNPDVLNRRSKEQFGAMDSMFAIGAMPDWIPRQHSAREFARANPREALATGTSKGVAAAGH
jgi:hypothetical protein